MAKKIATAAAVFRACDELDAGGQSWNRDDVRLRVGGGGFNVIDPLIQAWRSLKPLKAIAPNTPTELLHKVAESLEQHLYDFVAQAEKNVIDSQSIFEQTTSELSETIDSLNLEIAELAEAYQELKGQHCALSHSHNEIKKDLQEQRNSEERLLEENDGLRGRVQRLESELEETKDEHNKAIDNLERQHQEIIAASEKNNLTRLQSEKEEWQNAHQLSEDRLMRLLDKERQQSKSQLASLEETNTNLKASQSAMREKLSSLEDQLTQKTNAFTQLQSGFNDNVKTLDQLKDRHLALTADYETLCAKATQQNKLEQLEQAISILQDKISK